MKILITGYPGFVASHLTSYLMQNDSEVVTSGKKSGTQFLNHLR